eukprot:14277145-Alexandrium_andersonii.AAC.1
MVAIYAGSLIKSGPRPERHFAGTGQGDRHALPGGPNHSPPPRQRRPSCKERKPPNGLGQAR